MSEWISVKDKLPDEAVPVLVANNGGIYAALVVFEDEGWYWEAQSSFSPQLNDPSSYEADDEYIYTHWMPLPESPK